MHVALPEIKRRPTREITVGPLKIGGNNPIRVQSMTTPKTADVEAVVAQIHRLEEVQCDLVRVTVNKEESALALPDILKQIRIPLIADVHFDYKMALLAIKHGAHCVRINPGNIGAEWKSIEVIQAAQDAGVAVRIGVNAGSLEKSLLQKYGHPTPEALVESALRHIELLERLNFFNFKVSIKSSDVLANAQAYSLLSRETEAPLHVGVTEAGTKGYGMVKSSVGIGSLIMAGIGDTIRVSLAADPVDEVKTGIDILKSLGLRENAAEVIACPSCGRADIDVYTLAEEVERYALSLKKKIKIAVMGCVVNGPGESREADIGIAGGVGEGLIYKKGVALRKVPESQMLEFLKAEVERM